MKKSSKKRIIEEKSLKTLDTLALNTYKVCMMLKYASKKWVQNGNIKPLVRLDIFHIYAYIYVKDYLCGSFKNLHDHFGGLQSTGI